jgi:hypothetical protein
MQIDEEKVVDVVLALLHLTKFEESGNTRAWKSYDWGVLDRLYEKGFISNPKTNAKSIVLTDSGVQKSKELFEKYFTSAG